MAGALGFTGLAVLTVGLMWGFFKDSPSAPSLGPTIVMLAGVAMCVAAVWIGLL